MDKKLLLALVAANINVPGLLKGVLDQVLEPALQKLVDDTSHPFDNMAKEALYPVIEKELNDWVAKQWAELIELPAPVEPA
jgi:hypothetical protein